jgi:hypothetical protein
VVDDNPDGTPGVRASDADRATVIARLQTALGEGRIDLDEFGQRAAVVYDATTLAELDAVVADLPTDARPQVEIVGTRAPEVVSSVFGDVKLAGGSAPQRVSGVFGDIRIDLRGLRTDADRLDLYLSTVFGDVEVIVAEGVDAELQGRTVFGDRRTDLAPVPRLPGTPRIVVHARTMFGDLKLRSLAPGESASKWRALMDRLAGRLPPPPELPRL